MKSSVLFIGMQLMIYVSRQPFVNSTPMQRAPPLLTRFFVALVVVGGMSCQLPTSGHHDELYEINE